jgi:DNA helicase IV
MISYNYKKSQVVDQNITIKQLIVQVLKSKKIFFYFIKKILPKIGIENVILRYNNI